MTVFPVVFSSIVFIAYYGMGKGLIDFNLKVMSSNLNYFIVKRFKKISVTLPGYLLKVLVWLLWVF